MKVMPHNLTIRIKGTYNTSRRNVYFTRYDQYGNLVNILEPPNYQGQRSEYNHTYDSVVHSYVIETKNQFGQTEKVCFNHKKSARH
jgi:hypothetical protein